MVEKALIDAMDNGALRRDAAEKARQAGDTGDDLIAFIYRRRVRPLLRRQRQFRVTVSE